MMMAFGQEERDLGQLDAHGVLTRLRAVEEEPREQHVDVGQREQDGQRVHDVQELGRHPAGDAGAPGARARDPVGHERADRAPDEDADADARRRSAGRAPRRLRRAHGRSGWRGTTRTGGACSSRPCAMPMAAEPTTTKPSEAMPAATATGGMVKIVPSGQASSEAAESDDDADEHGQPDRLTLDGVAGRAGAHGHPACGQRLCRDADRGDDDEHAQKRAEGAELVGREHASGDHGEQEGCAVADHRGGTDEDEALRQRSPGRRRAHAPTLLTGARSRTSNGHVERAPTWPFGRGVARR